MSRPPDTFKKYRGGARRWENTYGASRYQPVIFVINPDETDTGETYTYQKYVSKKYVSIGAGNGWANEMDSERPVLYRSRRRAVRKAWGAVAKRELKQWKRA